MAIPKQYMSPDNIWHGMPNPNAKYTLTFNVEPAYNGHIIYANGKIYVANDKLQLAEILAGIIAETALTK
jgi:hypothetical protein